MTTWKTVHGDVEPAALDKVTSSVVVYERRNIHQEETEDPMTKETRTEWVYEERETPVDEYNQLHSPATQTIMQSLSNLELQVAMLG